jgi:AraC family L-rhamnose operon transcriptional activator RhaR
MVADLSGSGPTRFGRASGWLAAEELARVRERLNELTHGRPEKKGDLDLGGGGTALLLLESCRRACLSSADQGVQGSAVARQLLRSIDPGGIPPKPGELAHRVGFQQDYLNRLVRRSTGLTLGQWRARELLKASEKELAKGGSIAAAALKIGFSDANYFSRWFRRQTGMTPRSWRSRP